MQSIVKILPIIYISETTKTENMKKIAIVEINLNIAEKL